MKRANLSHDIRQILRDEIVTGALSPGEPLNTLNLARRLDVSRTPLREALVALVGEGLAREVPRRGFFVSPLRADELLQLYAVRQLLDPGALKLGGIPGPATIQGLESLNEALAKETDPQRIIDLDDQWHLLLVGGCANPILLDLIRSHMARTRRYEFCYMSQAENVAVATDEHAAIIDALRSGDLKGACRWLTQNLTSAEGPIIAFIRQLENP